MRFRRARDARLLNSALLLVGEQLLLPLDPPPVPRQAAILANHAVAGDDQTGGVGRTSPSHGADGGWPADVARDLAVGARLAVRNRLQISPHLPLKRRRLNVER